MKQSSSPLIIVSFLLLGLASMGVECNSTSPPLPNTATPIVSAPGASVTDTPTPGVSVTDTPTRDIPAPYPTITPSPTPIPLDDTALLFIVDSSLSMESRCQNILEARYQIPESFISFLSAYEQSIAGQYIGPKVGWITYPVIRFVDETRLPETADYYTFDIKELSEFRTSDWYTGFEAQANTTVEGFGHSFVLQALKDHIIQQTWPGISRFVVVQITDGIVQFRSGQASVTAERTRIETIVMELTELSGVEVELIVVQLPCEFGDDDPADPENNNDNALVWDRLVNRGQITLLGREANSVTDIVEELIATDAFNRLLPLADNWGFFSQPLVASELTLDDWLINIEVVSPEAVKAKDNNQDIVYFTLSGQRSERTLSRVNDLVYSLSDRPLKNDFLGDCNQKQAWNLIGSRDVLGFYIWHTTFGLRPELIDAHFESTDDANSLKNNNPLWVNITIGGDDLSQGDFNTFKDTSCYAIALFLLDENGQSRFWREIPLSEFNLGQPYSLEIALDWPLENGPQTVTLILQVVRPSDNEQVAIVEAIPVTSYAWFEPMLLDGQDATLSCDSSNCLLTVPFDYLHPDYYSGEAVEFDAVVVTRLSENHLNEHGCVGSTNDPDKSTSIIYIDDGRDQEAILYNPSSSDYNESFDALLVEFPQFWLGDKCGFNEVIIQLPTNPLIKCDLSEIESGVENLPCQERGNYELRKLTE